MKKLTVLGILAVMLLSASLFSGCTTYSTVPSEHVYYENPQWAPTYYSGVRYYYFPDIECYYDLATRDFIFLNSGQWFFTPTFPTMYYSNFDLYNSFIIIINYNIFQPWRHHQYYVSHYPRYYYRDYYDYSGIPYVRGFNENSKSAVYWDENQRERARPWNDDNLRNNRQFRYTPADRQRQIETTNRLNQERGITTGTSTRSSSINQPSRTTDNTTVTRDPQRQTNQTSTSTSTSTRSSNTSAPTRQETTSRRTDNTNYYGGTIGQPVRVQRQMREQTSTSTSERSSTSTSTGSGGRSSNTQTTTGGRR